jgi:hypothetical protein
MVESYIVMLHIRSRVYEIIYTMGVGVVIDPSEAFPMTYRSGRY